MTDRKAIQTTLFSPLVEQAIELASQWHDGTYRKGSWRDAPFTLSNDQLPRTPVIFHLTSVAFSVHRAGWDPVTTAASFLHDILEDPNRSGAILSERTLEEVMGSEVTRLVVQLTEQKVDAEGKSRAWRARKEEFLDDMRGFLPGAVAICLADKHHNLWSVNQGLLHKVDIFEPGPNRKPLNSGPHEQLWYFRNVLEISRSHEDPKLEPLRQLLANEVTRFAEFLEQAP